MSDITVKVSTQELLSAAGHMTDKVEQTYATFQEIEEIIKRSSGYWEGEGHNSMVNAYERRSDDYHKIFIAIKEHIAKLVEMAGIYSETERKNVELSVALIGDVIE